jgi:hypothetical protein
VVAGIVVMSAIVTDMSPLLKWSLAIIAGGGAAATVQAITVVGRGTSTATTGGLGNPVVSTIEAASSTALSVLAIAVPVIVLAVLAVLAALAVRSIVRRFRRQARVPAVA